jgi:hypothetical protein
LKQHYVVLTASPLKIQDTAITLWNSININDQSHKSRRTLLQYLCKQKSTSILIIWQYTIPPSTILACVWSTWEAVELWFNKLLEHCVELFGCEWVQFINPPMPESSVAGERNFWRIQAPRTVILGATPVNYIRS